MSKLDAMITRALDSTLDPDIIDATIDSAVACEVSRYIRLTAERLLDKLAEQRGLRERIERAILSKLEQAAEQQQMDL